MSKTKTNNIKKTKRGMKPKPKWFKNLFRRRMFVVLLLAIQLALFVYFIVSTGKISQVISDCLTTVSIGVALYVISRDIPSGYKLTWIFMILVFPVFGGMLYLLFSFQSGTKNLRKLTGQAEERSRKYAQLNSGLLSDLRAKRDFDASCASYLELHCNFPVYDCSETFYYPMGEDYFSALIPELEKAEKYVFLEFFIIEEGEFWDSLLSVLEKKAAAGVDVRVLYDDMGCFLTLPKEYPRVLAEKGIKCYIFNPFKPILASVQNNRDHRKIISIDGKVAFTGGINLADEYINKYEKHGHWKDTGIKVTGKAAWSLTVMFLSMWRLYSNDDDDYTTLCPSSFPVSTKGYIQPYSDSPLDNEPIGEQVYLKLIQRATDYIYISTPYLIIDNTLLNSLESAAKSGVDVRIITPFVPDKKIIHFTTRSYYPPLIAAGVKIYEYEPGFIHAKSAVTDDRTAVVGTVNLDYRSLNLHFECGVCMYDCDTVAAVKEDFIGTLAICRRITAEECRGSGWDNVVKQFVRLFAPLM